MAILVLRIGVYPGPLLEISQASVEKILAVYTDAGVAIR
jgi:NADH:ubiquinone oxidoreductase subunit 4 (subunit M)